LKGGTSILLRPRLIRLEQRVMRVYAARIEEIDAELETLAAIRQWQAS
jgi:hypothetical protein